MNSFTFFEDYYDLITLLEDEKDQAELTLSILKYMFDDIEPTLNAKQMKIFKNLKRPLVISKNKSKCKKNIIKTKSNENQIKIKMKSNQNQNEIKSKSNENHSFEFVTKSMSMSMSNNNSNNNINSNNNSVYKDIIEYLNNKTNSHYKHTTSKTMKLIQARLNENFTIDDFKKVIDNKSQEWMGTEFENYLRPETLFGNKFESYLNQKNNKPIQKPMTYQERKKQEEDKMWEKFLAGGKENE